MEMKIKLFIGCLFTLAALTARSSCHDQGGTQAPIELLGSTTERPESIVSQDDVASRFKAAFFKLIDFKSFKAKFNKHYGSLMEEIARHKLFLARHLKAKLSMIAYQIGLSTSHSGINRMSDWTQGERDRLKNKLDAGGQPTRHRKRRSVDASAEERTVAVQPMSEAEAQQIGAIKDVSLLDRGLSSIAKALKKVTGGGGGGGGRSGGENMDDQRSYDRKGGVRVDLRKTGCFNKPRHQGLCGSCYAFAALSQYEFMYCLAYGKKIKFSEQFIVDCGPEHLQMGGCEGGTPAQVAQFAHTLGLQKFSAYPYSDEQGECRLPTAREDPSAVHAKTKSPGTLVAANLNEYEHWLKRNVPLYVSFGMDDSSYYDYAGGIDNPTVCDTDTGHAMLVVGVGSDDKHGDYFILRNSLGTDWGRSGYYYVYKQAPCWRHGGAAWAPEGLRDKGKNAFSGVRQREVDKDVDAVQLVAPVVHVPRQEPETKLKSKPEAHNNFDEDDEDDDEIGNKNKSQDYEISEVRTWTPAPPPKFEWKPDVHVPLYNPYEGLESNYEYNFNGDPHYYSGNNNQQSSDNSYNSYENYGSYFDRYRL